MTLFQVANFTTDADPSGQATQFYVDSIPSFLYTAYAQDYFGHYASFITILRYISIVIRIAEIVIYMPIYLNTDMTKNILFQQTRKSHLFILPLMALIFTPRFLLLIFFFGVWRSIGCVLVFSTSITIYMLAFALMINRKYKKEWNQNSTPLLQSLFTSFFTPCIIMYPESKLIFHSSVVSTIPHLILVSALHIMAKYYPDDLSPKIAPEALEFLIPSILIAPIFSWLIYAYSQEKTQKLLIGALSFKLLKFFILSIVLCALDEVSDILSAMDFFR